MREARTRALFTTQPVGRDVDISRLPAVAANVRVEPFVPQSLVLSRASLVVAHAGLGTVLGAIYHGIPMVVVALGADQPINARRAAALGIAVALEPREAKAAALLAATQRALDDPGLRAAAQALRLECDAMEPIDQAVKALAAAAAKP